MASDRSGGTQAIQAPPSWVLPPCGHTVSAQALQREAWRKRRERKGCHTYVLDHTGQTVCLSVYPGTHSITVRAVQVQFGSGLVKTRFFSFPWGHRNM